MSHEPEKNKKFEQLLEKIDFFCEKLKKGHFLLNLRWKKTSENYI
jgi:hypothetical protein